MLLKLIAVCVVVFGLIGTGSSQNNNARLAEIGDVRLAPFSGAPGSGIVREGVVEILYESKWVRVCKEGWGKAESFVACGNLGFSEAAPDTSLSQRYQRRYDQNIQYAAIFCYGTETRLTECKSVVAPSTSCASGTAATLSCRQRKAEGIRLRGGALPGEGRVQVAYNSLYGSICSSGWNLQTASVACRQLGFGTARRIYTRSEFGQGHFTIWFKSVTCQGKEKRLTDCSYDLATAQNSLSYSQNGCSNRNLAGVSCHTPYGAYQDQIKLLDGYDRTVGRVTVNIGGAWGSVCGGNWGLNEASVVCRQLGLGYASKALKDVSYMTSSGMYLSNLISNVRCTGTENSLTDCKFDTNYGNSLQNCGQGASYVGVACTKNLPDLQLDIGELQRSVYLDVKPMQALRCAAEENCLGSSASYSASYAYSMRGGSSRRLLRMTTSVWNRGTSDFYPAKEPNQWEWHQCHRHYHSMGEFAHYDILSTSNPGQTVAQGHKASFCLSDTRCEPGYAKTYVCSQQAGVRARQGISVGCTDIYYARYDCQWIDITDVSPGNYIIRVRLNPAKIVAELDHENNEVTCQLTYDGRSAWATSCRFTNDLA